MQMKKFITMCLSAALLAGATSAEARVTLRQAQQMQREGKGIKMLHDGNKKAQSNMLRVKGNGFGKIASRPTSSLVKKAPAKVTDGGSDIYGYCNYSTQIQQVGAALYELMSEGLEMTWQDPAYIELGGYTFSGAYVKDGVFKGYIPETFWGMTFGIDYAQIDFESGELLSVEPLDLATAPIYNRLAYVPTEDMVYGFGLMADYQNTVFMCSEDSDPSTATVIAEFEDVNTVPVAFCYNPVENAFFGIDMNQNFCRYDFDGTQTVLFSLADAFDFVGTYYAGLAYSPIENVYYWNINQDVDAFMGRIDMSGNVDVYEQLADGNQLTFLFCTNEAIINEFAPKRPEIAEISFPAGDLTGFVSYTLPSEYAGGAMIPSDVVTFDVYTTLDGEVTGQGTGKPGEVYSATYENLSEGKHKFGCYVSCDGVESTQVSKTVYIGNDTPQAPKNVILTDNMVTWDAIPALGVNKGYLAIDDIQYIVYLQGEEYGRTKECKLPIVLPADEPLNIYQVEVVAECNGKTSEATESNSVIAGQPLEIPVSIAPTLEEAQLCSIYDGNGNGASWTYAETNEGGVFQISYTMPEEGNQDDWLFLPPIKIDNVNKYYTLSYEVMARSARYPEEYMEVCIGTAPNPEAMIETLVDEYQPEAEVYTSTNGYVKAPAAGVYYIGFHCTSEADMMGLNLRNIKLFDENITNDSPAAVNNLEAVAFDQGVLKATVSFSFPTKTMGGSELAADAALKATVVAAETLTVEGKPGEKVSVEIATVQNMNHIVARASLGDLNGPAETVDVYTGVEVPATVTDLVGVAAPDMMSMTLTWEGPTEGFDGGFIVPEDVTYDIYMVVPGFFGDEWAKIDEAGKNKTYTYVCEEGQVQDLVQLGVVACNAAGDCGYLQSASDVLGTPWTLPMDENFDDPDAPITYTPWMIYQADPENPVKWAIDYLTNVDDTYVPEHIGLVGTGSEGAVSTLGVPRFTTKDYEEVTMVFNLYTGEDSADYAIYGYCYGMEEPVLLSEIKGDNAGTQFADYEVKLPADLLGKDWVEVQIQCSFNSDEDVAIIDSFFADGKGVGTGIGSALNSKTISGGKNIITVRGFEGQNVTISALDGAVVAKGIATSNEQVYNLNKGVYVVKAGDRKAKVLVK